MAGTRNRMTTVEIEILFARRLSTARRPRPDQRQSAFSYRSRVETAPRGGNGP